MTENKILHTKYMPYILFASGLIIRLLLGYFNAGFSNDTACFSAWADRMFSVGPSEFYSSDMFTDYPPGFMYILYPIGALCSLLHIETYSGVHLLLLKSPAILCDMLCSYLLYREVAKHCSLPCTCLLTAAYLLNPAILLNSSVWGQVDSVYTLAVVMLCLYLVRGKLIPAYITFGAGILIKPQMLIFAPLLLIGILDNVFGKDFSIKKLLYHLMHGISVIIGMLLLCLPFGLSNVLPQYTTTLGSYPYASVNAYNFWSLLGLNWASQDNTFLLISYKNWGVLFIILLVLFTFILSHLMKNKPYKYPVLGAFIILTMFFFSVRMHERYMYAGLILLLFTYLYQPTKPLFMCFGLFSLFHFANTAHVFYCYNPANYDFHNPVILMISAGMLFTLIYFYRSLYLSYCTKETVLPTWTPFSGNIRGNNMLWGNVPEDGFYKKTSFTKMDFLLLSLIVILYSLFALYDLGDTYAPTTSYEMTQGDSIIIEWQEGNPPTALTYYIAPQHGRNFTVECRNAVSDSWNPLGDITLENVFTWTDIPLTEYSLNQNNVTALRLTLTDSQASILELALKTGDGNIILPANSAGYPALYDENNMVPTQSSFRNSMYFDEIYHGRTAYEFLNGLTTYETTHPPLGKIFISIGVALFGMNPFGWRIMGTLFGIAMLPFFYLFGKKITGNTPVTALACFLFTFDFMHFAQTRIATIDVYITFFVIVMYYFMYQYCTLDFSTIPFPRTLLPLGACGIAMGLGFACKWTGAYAGVGLALLFFATLPRIPRKGRTIGFCMLFFVTIPALIYLLSYLPFAGYTQEGLLTRMLKNQSYMLGYHGNLEATHPFSSSWWQWPTMIRPIWYYSGVLQGNLREGISAFGNPLVWWLGIPAFIYMIYLATKKKDRIAVFLIIGYLAQYLPWFFVSRITFIYHYFPSVVFVVLMLAHSLMQLKKYCSTKAFTLLIVGYGIATFILFLMFYPVLSGQPVTTDYVNNFLRWFDSWIFIAG